MKKTILLNLLGIVLLVELVVVIYQEQNPPWRKIQSQYLKMAHERALQRGDAVAAAKFSKEVPRLREIFIPELGILDRCMTCHSAIENPDFESVSNPLRMHPGGYIRDHPPERFACTSCHAGTGRATVIPSAHIDPSTGTRESNREMIFASCGKCHPQVDLFGPEFFLADLHGQPLEVGELTQQGLRGDLLRPDIPLHEGRRTVLESGCLGCHSYRGKGGRIGPDITYTGSKPLSEYDFTSIPETPRTRFDWHIRHLENPAGVIRGTVMPVFGFPDAKRRATATFLLSLVEKKSPPEFCQFLPLQQKPRTPADGQTLYAVFCSACHGTKGEARIFSNFLSPAIGDPLFLYMIDEEFLVNSISEGRINTRMQKWKLEENGLTPSEISRIARYIFTFKPPPPTIESIRSLSGIDMTVGRKAYTIYCHACHGDAGMGGIGPVLNSPEFLSHATEEFLFEAIVKGRAGTSMPSWGHLKPGELRGLLALHEIWGHTPPKEVTTARPRGCPEKGSRLYAQLCASCHGDRGEGINGFTGTSLASPDFLRTASDEFIRQMMILHRTPSGASSPYRTHFGVQYPTDTAVNDIISFIRTWSQSRIPLDVKVTGSERSGRILYQQHCARCHGREGEGVQIPPDFGPVLNDPIFLKYASNAYLQMSIAFGRTPSDPDPQKAQEHQFGKKLTPQQINDIIIFIRGWYDNKTN